MNCTQLQTKGDYGGTVATAQVPGFRPRTGNISINCRKGRYEVRLQTNWLDTYVTIASTNAVLLAYEAPRTTTNAKFTYTIGRGTSVYFNWDNVFREPEVNNWRGYRHRMATTRLIYPSIAAGIQGRL